MKKIKIYILKLNFKNVNVWNLDFSSTFLKRKSLKFRVLKYISPFKMNSELLKIEIYGQIEHLPNHHRIILIYGITYFMCFNACTCICACVYVSCAQSRAQYKIWI